MNTRLTLDWDIDYATVTDSVSYGILKRFLKDNASKIRSAYIRRSSSGNTHVIVYLNEPQDDTTLYRLRYLLRDDIMRIKLDNIRDLIQSGEWSVGNYRVGGAGGTGRLFDWKIKNGSLSESGEWTRIY